MKERNREIKTNRGADTDPGVPFVNIAARNTRSRLQQRAKAKVALGVFFRAIHAHTVLNNETTDI